MRLALAFLLAPALALAGQTRVARVPETAAVEPLTTRAQVSLTPMSAATANIPVLAPANEPYFKADVVALPAAAAAQAPVLPQPDAPRPLLRRVVEAVQLALSGRSTPEIVPIERLFDNSARRAGDVRASLGFNPASTRGSLLSDAAKTNVVVEKVTPGRGNLPTAVIKRAATGSIQRELFVRNVIAEFPLFSDVFDTIEATGYVGRLGTSVMVMPHKDLRWLLELDLAAKTRMAALAHGLGIADVNGGGVRRVPGSAKPMLLDFEHALTPLRGDMNGQQLSHPMFHVSQHSFNDMADYKPAIEEWRRLLRENGPRIRQLMLRSGFSPAQADDGMRVLENNARLMEPVIERSLATGDRDFLKDAGYAGLDEAETAALSELNRALMRTGDAGPRDAIRAYNREHGERWKIWPPKTPSLTAEEYKAYLNYRAGGAGF